MLGEMKETKQPECQEKKAAWPDQQNQTQMHAVPVCFKGNCNWAYLREDLEYKRDEEGNGNESGWEK